MAKNRVAGDLRRRHTEEDSKNFICQLSLFRVRHFASKLSGIRETGQVPAT